MEKTFNDAVMSMLFFLHQSMNSEGVDAESAESLQVAIDCIQRAYKIKYDANERHFDIINMIKKQKHDPVAADKKKDEGNEFLRQEKYDEAIKAYTEAIELDDRSHIFYSNRAAAYMKKKDHYAAIDDCYLSIAINPTYSKAYARLGSAFLAIQDNVSAEKAFSKAVELEPQNTSYADNLKYCKSLLDSASAPTAQMPSEFSGGFPGMPNFNELLSNPGFLDMAQTMMQSPGVQEMMSNLMGSFAQNPQGAPGASGLDSFKDMAASLVSEMEKSDPNMLENLKKTFKGGGNQGQPPASS